MKKLFIVLISLLLSFSIFAHEGSMVGAGKLRFTQTKYFDLIYGEKNLASANILYEKADAVFVHMIIFSAIGEADRRHPRRACRLPAACFGMPAWPLSAVVSP